MERIEKLVSKLHLDRFFSSKLILVIDLVISVAASVASLIFERLLISDKVITDYFILGWVGLSVVFSLIYFLVFKTYRVIVRHTTLKEFARICLASFLKSMSIGLLMMVLPFMDTYFGLLILIDCFFTIGFLLMVRVAMIIAYDM
ncbi:MAG: polysaccharide biosynthesis protein, partial [Rikenellaceae bacterium]|nr:polysaccharide biosynthesis protein [Rikenellaceae bacterium]